MAPPAAHAGRGRSLARARARRARLGARLSRPPADLEQGLADRYRLVRELGTGGMASVWLVEDLKHGREVALKVLRPELSHSVGVERFEREIRLAARLQHPHICSVYDSGELPAAAPGETPRLWFTMPYVEGESVRDRLRREGHLSVAEAVRIAREAAQALQYAHDKGVVHRDVKPENLLLASDGSTLVADFGIARPAEAPTQAQRLTATGISVGTPTYMAPEQVTADRRLDGRADQYALAATVFELLSGRPPFVASTGAALIAQRFSTPTASVRALRPDVPAHVDAALARAMSLDPAARFASVSEFARALERESLAHGPAERTRPSRTWLLAVAVLVIVAAGYALLRRPAPASSGDTRIAVLPFAMLGGDSAGAYVGEGLADEVTTSLAQVRGLRVASRSAAARFAGRRVQDVASALGVDAVMEGSVRRAGERLRVSAQLTSARDGLVLWAKGFDRPAGDVFALQEDIASDIVAALRDRLGVTGAAPASHGGSRDPVAYDLYLRGRYFWSRRGSQGLRTAIDFYSQAIARDPSFARARAGLAMAYGVMPFFGGATADSVMPLAEASALGALRLDSTLADAHLALGNVRRYQWRWDEAERHLRRATELAPDDATTHQWLGGVLYATGRIAEGVVETREAHRLDPYSAVIAGDFVYSLSVAGDTSVLSESARMLELDSTLAVSHAVNGMVLLRAGRAEEAVRSFERARRIGDAPYSTGFEVAALLAAGRKDEARTMYAALLRELDRRSDATWDAAYAATALGDTARAFPMLARIVERHEAIVSEFSLPCDAGFASLHADPRFGQLLARAGMQRCRR